MPTGSVTVTPGKQFTPTETWTPGKMNQGFQPTAQVDANAITDREMAAGAVSSKNFAGKSVLLDRSGSTPGIYQSSDYVQGVFVDGLVTVGSTNFTSATANFSAGDVGRLILGAGILPGTTIAVYINATTVTLSAPGFQQFLDAVTNATTTLTSATANFQPADAGRTITGDNIPSGTTIASVTNTTTIVLSQAATDSKTGGLISISGRQVPNTQFVVVGRGRGWKIQVDGNGVGSAEIYVGTLAATIAVGTFSVAADGSLTIGTGSTKLTANSQGDFVWGSGPNSVGMDHAGKFFAGAASYELAPVKIVENGQVTIRDLPSIQHTVDSGVFNPFVQPVTAAPAGGAITNPTSVTLDCVTRYRRIYYRSNAKDGVTNGTTTFTSATGAFTAKDIGKTIASAGNIPAGTFIAAVASSTSITLSQAATTTATALDYQITPDQTDTLYVDGTPIVLTATTRLTARAFKNGEYSELDTWLFSIDPTTVPNPSMSPSPGSYGGGSLVVTLSDSLAGSVIFYTLDGTSPTHDGSLNPTGTSVKISGTSGTVTLPTGTTTIKAMGSKTGVTDSSVVSGTYAVSAGGGTKVATPTFNPDGFISPGHGSQTVTIATTTSGAQIRYTKDGSTPSETNGTLIAGTSGTANIPANTDKILQAIAFKTGLLDSDVKSAEYDFIP